MIPSSLPPPWRSMLFVPAHVDKFIAGAATRGADACILDLEDGVPLASKATARDMLAASVLRVTRSGAAALVRVNSPLQGQALDLHAAVQRRVAAIVLPKVGSGADVREAANVIGRLEAERGLATGTIRLVAQIEDVHALTALDDIAGSSPRLMAMILGSEDFSASAGMSPTPAALLHPNQQVLFACRRAGLWPFGFPASIADFSDVEAFRRHVRFARELGFVGAFCVHPAQVAVMNEEFAPSPAEIHDAMQLVAAYETAQAQGRGAVEHRGKMVDLPVVLRARELLARQPQSISQETP